MADEVPHDDHVVARPLEGALLPVEYPLRARERLDPARVGNSWRRRPSDQDAERSGHRDDQRLRHPPEARQDEQGHDRHRVQELPLVEPSELLAGPPKPVVSSRRK